jgi:hypothetical protein
MRVAGAAFFVHEPVVHLKLDPRRRQHVERRRRLEHASGEELPAHRSRIRCVQAGEIGKRLAQRGVAAESRAGASHQPDRQVVAGAVDRPADFRSLRDRTGALWVCRLFGVEEILPAQLVTDLDQLGERDGSWQVVPLVVKAHDACSCLGR